MTGLLATGIAAAVDVTGHDLGAFRDFARERGHVIERNGLGIFATGVAARIDLPLGLGGEAVADAVASVLSAFAPVAGGDGGGGGCAPLALGALPFDRAAPAHLVVPSTVLVERPDSAFVVLAGTDPDSVLRNVESWESSRTGPLLEEIAPARAPDSFRLASLRPHDDFRSLVAATVAAIRAGDLEKVVLVREVTVEANRDLHASSLVRALRRLYPSCAAFSIEGFVGASPELLLARNGHEVSSHPLAGTIGRSGDDETDTAAEQALLHSPKDRAEHRVVVEAIAGALSPLCGSLEVPDLPSIMRLRNVSHLGTLINGHLSSEVGALELVARLHPTPAVAGTPTDAALAWIAAHEGVARGPYAGPLGWVDVNGDGEWYLGIRAALVDGPRARLFAGAGIVADSDPDDELTETQLKLQALLAAAVRP